MNETSPTSPTRNGYVTALMVMFGVILLLPGICALVFAVDTNFDLRFIPVLVLALLVAFAGVMLIRAARKRS